jgi:hypothetical protein
MSLFQPGAIIERREVLHGELWLSCPMTVVHDDGQHLAIRLDPGAPFTFPPHPFGEHPWARHSHWGDSIVLQLYRSGDLYSVWKFFEPDGTFRHWYVNFEAPLHRGSGGIDTDDYGLDLVIDPHGERQWKDVTDLHHQRVEGRISHETVLDVLAEAARLETALDDGDLWWAPWSDWLPEPLEQP